MPLNINHLRMGRVEQIDFILKIKQFDNSSYIIQTPEGEAANRNRVPIISMPSLNLHWNFISIPLEYKCGI